MTKLLKILPRQSVTAASTSDSLTAFFSSWQRNRAPPIYPNAQTGRTVTASEFYLFYVAVLLLITGLGLIGTSLWSMLSKSLYTHVLDCSPELAYFALPSALLCLPCFWMVLSIHNDVKTYKFLPLVLIFLAFSVVLVSTGVYVGFTHKFRLKRSLIADEVRPHMKESLKAKALIWDRIQRKLRCCGVDDFTDWVPVIQRIPRACCVKGNCEANGGCLEAIMADLALHTCVLNGIHCVALFIQSFAFIAAVSIYLYDKIKGRNEV